MKHSVRELYEEIGTIQKGPLRPSYDTITHGILINENIPSGKICLDLGCGGGHYLNGQMSKKQCPVLRKVQAVSLLAMLADFHS